MSVCCCELSASLAVSTGLMAVFSHRLKFKNIPAFFNGDKQVIRSELVRGCFNECRVLIRSSAITCSPPELFFWMLDFGVSRQDGRAVKGAALRPLEGWSPTPDSVVFCKRAISQKLWKWGCSRTSALEQGSKPPNTQSSCSGQFSWLPLFIYSMFPFPLCKWICIYDVSHFQVIFLC